MQVWSVHRSAHSLLLLTTAVLGACANTDQPMTIDVIANDYAFLSPDALAPDQRSCLQNRGAKDHELFIGLLRPGATASQIVAAHQQDIPFRQLPRVYPDGAVSVALIATPGTTSPARVILDLLSGRSYVLFCQLRDSIGAPQHAALGTFRVLRVN